MKLRTACWLGLLALACGRVAPDDDRAWGVGEARQLVRARDVRPSQSPTQLVVFAPLGLERHRLALSASSSLHVGPGVQIQHPNPHVTAREWGVAAALGSIELGSSARLGALYGYGPITRLDLGASVASYLKAFGAVQGAASTSPRLQSLGLTNDWVEAYSWDVPFTAATNDVVGSPQGVALKPGHYRSLRVGGNAVATLGAGDYFFDTLELAPHAELRLQNAQRPLRVWIKSRLVLRGGVRESNLLGNVLWGFAGTEPPRIDQDFHGTLVAPNTLVRLNKTDAPHVGAFFARDIEVGPDTRIEQRPFILDPVVTFELEATCDECGKLAAKVAADCCASVADYALIDSGRTAACHGDCRAALPTEREACEAACQRENQSSDDARRDMARGCERDVTERYSACMLKDIFRPGSCVYAGLNGPAAAACTPKE